MFNNSDYERNTECWWSNNWQAESEILCQKLSQCRCAPTKLTSSLFNCTSRLTYSMLNSCRLTAWGTALQLPDVIVILVTNKMQYLWFIIYS